MGMGWNDGSDAAGNDITYTSCGKQCAKGRQQLRQECHGSHVVQQSVAFGDDGLCRCFCNGQNSNDTADSGDTDGVIGRDDAKEGKHHRYQSQDQCRNEYLVSDLVGIGTCFFTGWHIVVCFYDAACGCDDSCSDKQEADQGWRYIRSYDEADTHDAPEDTGCCMLFDTCITECLDTIADEDQTNDDIEDFLQNRIIFC